MTESRDRHRFMVEHAGKTLAFEIVPEKGVAADTVKPIVNADVSTSNFVLQVSAECVEDHECDEPHVYASKIAAAAERAMLGMSVAPDDRRV